MKFLCSWTHIRNSFQMRLTDLSLFVTFNKTLKQYQAIATLPTPHTNVIYNFTVSPINLQIESESNSITFDASEVKGKTELRELPEIRGYFLDDSENQS